MENELLKCKDWSPTFIMQNISEEMTHHVHELVQSVDVSNYESVLFFGTKAQKQLVNFSQVMLQFTQKNDQLNITSTMENLGGLIANIKVEDFEEKKSGLLRKVKSFFQPSTSERISNFRQTNAQMDRLMVMLERNKIVLTKDIDLLNELYKQNEIYVQTIDAHIAAAKQVLKSMVTEHETLIIQKSIEDWKVEKERNHILDALEILQSRIYELELSREVGLQMLMQTKMLLSSNKLLIEKIQSSLLTTIPLWKNQFSIYLSSLKAKQTNEFNHKMSRLHQQLNQNQPLLEANDHRKLSLDELRSLHRNLTNVINETVQLQLESEQVKETLCKSFSSLEGELSNRLENGEKYVPNN